jgi:hypothetical protein
MTDLATIARPGKSTVRTVVRHAEPRDVGALIGLINALAREATLLFVIPIDPQTGGPCVLQYLDAMTASGNGAVLVAERAGELVGLATGNGGVHASKRGVVELGIGVRRIMEPASARRSLPRWNDGRAARVCIACSFQW